MSFMKCCFVSQTAGMCVCMHVGILLSLPSYLSWVWGSSHVGGRQPSLQSAGCRRSLALGQTPSSHVWSPLMSLSSSAGLCGPTPASPAQCTKKRQGHRKESIIVCYYTGSVYFGENRQGQNVNYRGRVRKHFRSRRRWQRQIETCQPLSTLSAFCGEHSKVK